MELEFLKALVLVFGVSALMVFLLHRIRIPPLVGFIVAGVLIGPGGFGIVQDTHAIELLAEVGVILLLFTVGIEFSLRNLMRIKRTVLLGGGGQVLLTILAVTGLSYFLTRDVRLSLFLGFLTALSSTAIVLKVLLEAGETDAPHGKQMVGVLIFQDLCVVPLMLLVPALSGEGVDLAALVLTFAKALGIIALVLLASRWVVPVFLHNVVHTRSRELFLISVIVICLGTALLTSRFGLSLALGAFLAGLVISESEYSYEATAEILPFKDSFMGLFFVSIGMLIDMGFIAKQWPLVLVAVLAILVVKALAATLSVIPTASSLRVSIHTGVGLAQIGEFSFILAAVGRSAGIVEGGMYQLFLSSAVITMALTPLLLKVAPPLSVRLTRKGPLSRFFDRPTERPFSKVLLNHVIIAGFGLNGRNLAGTLSETGIPYVVLELNSDTVRRERQKGQPISFGDATSREVLHKMGVKTAKVLVVAISDPVATRKIVALARKENPNLHIIVRTRYVLEVEDLRSLGADEIIPEEFETSVEIFSRVLHHYNVPLNVINDRIEAIRQNSYRALRAHELPHKTMAEREDIMSQLQTESYLVKDGSPLAGHSLRELHLRGRTGATVIAIEREGKAIHNPSGETTIKEGDILLLMGAREDLSRALEYFESDAVIISRYHV
ncbi:MAG: cation:proton antiporter [Nitrospirota bacterium]|jgi:CPA2 family monovalent cation:H+ antiporter-2